MKRMIKYLISATLIFGLLVAFAQTQTKADVFTIDKSKIPGVNDYPVITYIVTIPGTNISYEGVCIADSAVNGVPTTKQLTLMDTGDIVLTNNVNIGSLVLTGANSIDVDKGVTVDISTLIALDKNTRIVNDFANQYQVVGAAPAGTNAPIQRLTPEEQEALGRQYADTNWESDPESSIPSSTIIVDTTRTPEIETTRMPESGGSSSSGDAIPVSGSH
ncbi:MAG: hypothetical protein Q4G60_01665 [bacterium]|nr:hypothetical protein [bacterium]